MSGHVKPWRTDMRTHAHFDHLWDISNGENVSLLVPSAELVANEAEVAFWSAPNGPTNCLLL
jgi:hypothetical protein